MNKDFIYIIERDILLFEDAYDILVDLKRQGVNTQGCEKFFKERIKQLKEFAKKGKSE